MAEHDTWLPGFTLTPASETILGGTGEEMFEFSQYCNICLLSECEGQTPETVCTNRKPNIPVWPDLAQ